METPNANSNIAEPGWSRPKPERLVKPTWWPAALAFGATLLVWGLIVSRVIFACGVVMIAISLTGWIGEIRHEHNDP